MTKEELHNEIINGPLAEELVEHITSGNDQEIANVLNRKDILSDGKVTAHDIQQYLMVVDLLLPIEDSTTMSCRKAKRALELFPVFDTSAPSIKAKLIEVLDGLVEEELIPDFTEEHKNTILSFASIYKSRAEVLGIFVDAMSVARALR